MFEYFYRRHMLMLVLTILMSLTTSTSLKYIGFLLQSSSLLTSSLLTSFLISNNNIDYPSNEREYVLTALSSLDIIYNDINDNTNAQSLYKDINQVMTNYRLLDNIKLMTRSIYKNDECKDRGERIIEELITLFEYFSISNDGKTKVMISDAVPNQKRDFLKMGLKQIKQDINTFLFCTTSS